MFSILTTDFCVSYSLKNKKRKEKPRLCLGKVVFKERRLISVPSNDGSFYWLVGWWCPLDSEYKLYACPCIKQCRSLCLSQDIPFFQVFSDFLLWMSYSEYPLSTLLPAFLSPNGVHNSMPFPDSFLILVSQPLSHQTIKLNT